MLSDSLKKEIRTNYELITQALPQFKARKAQNYLVAEIAKVLAGNYDKARRILVAEAGTGIGKSLAYILAGLPVALRANKKLIISTATVTLQEQLITKDLPFFLRHSDYKFTFTLAKGRQRYCCEHKLLNQQVDNTEQTQLFTEKPQAGDRELLDRLRNAYLDGKWNGDQDSWPKPIPRRVWQQIISDKHSCKKALTNHRQCPFHRARDKINKADVIVVNHALLLADLELGGGVILPEPDASFYVLDEAHHLPKIARDFSSASVNIKTSQDWLKKIKQVSTHVNRVVHRQTTITPGLNMLESANEMVKDLNNIELYFRNNPLNYNKSNQYRFSMGEVPQGIVNSLISLKEETKKCLSAVNKLSNITSEELKDDNIKLSDAEPILIETGFYIQRLEALSDLWKMLLKDRRSNQAPIAAWINNENDAYTICASPLEVGGLLEYMLWSQAAGVVLCSATLTSLNSFDYFMRQAGLAQNDGTQYLRLKSPFDYPNINLHVAAMKNDPTESGFDNELIDNIAQRIELKEGNLVLFASYWQMNLVAEKLRRKFPKSLLVQGETSRTKMISLHKNNCDQGLTSILFGTGSLAEGLDLPGHYLTNLIITKLPFAVPDSPVEEAHAEWITSKGGNPFMQITIPEASKKLIQSCGRLIRKETDTGKITLLDKRVITKRYGKSLIDALPPFALKIEK
ncbi:ATP-dependent DNA helicase DinG [Psychromonas sp. 14N.309.X.WAT.B.A12]|uniref:ATP-dependent DNA helicase DinG n=1 Tax=Psychromonas sp. 14N.309.X.WAT.B.A12 TaxID=2998322 RepID=UPI0025B1CA69|nr:ATP-dependent DNA helicase DinG [Psychromonas sp. 14N.309.X.WAT.B.A12]MDN2663193.1 ATP-dependent DNA helicase DinG [Psychromonas sp. 14N.309.X.WAT.B.A12]